MSDHPLDFIDDILPEEPNGELVHWMEPKPLSLGAMGITAATVGAFALGVGVAVAAMAVMHMQQRAEPAFAVPRRRKKLRRR